MPEFILASLISPSFVRVFISSVLLNSSHRFRKRKLSHALRVKPRSIFFVCLFDFAAPRVSLTLDLYVNALGKKAVECRNHLTHTHLSCPFVPLYREVQKEPFVEQR